MEGQFCQQLQAQKLLLSWKGTTSMDVFAMKAYLLAWAARESRGKGIVRAICSRLHPHTFHSTLAFINMNQEGITTVGGTAPACPICPWSTVQPGYTTPTQQLKQAGSPSW